jgi:hypothetical protein
MDAAPKSKRLYPGYTVEELYEAVKSPSITEAERDRFNLAIRQRDKLSQDYMPINATPQIGPVSTCIEHAYGTAQRLSFQIKVF